MAKARDYNNHASKLDVLQDKVLVNNREKTLLELEILFEKFAHATDLENKVISVDYDTFILFLTKSEKLITELKNTNF